jgi:hypothetical protein
LFTAQLGSVTGQSTKQAGQEQYEYDVHRPSG